MSKESLSILFSPIAATSPHQKLIEELAQEAMQAGCDTASQVLDYMLDIARRRQTSMDWLINF